MMPLIEKLWINITIPEIRCLIDKCSRKDPPQQRTNGTQRVAYRAQDRAQKKHQDDTDLTVSNFKALDIIRMTIRAFKFCLLAHNISLLKIP